MEAPCGILRERGRKQTGKKKMGKERKNKSGDHGAKPIIEKWRVEKLKRGTPEEKERKS